MSHNLKDQELAASHAILVSGRRSMTRASMSMWKPPVTSFVVSDLSSLPKDKSYAVFVQTTFEVSTYETIIRAMGDAGYQFFSANKVCASPIKRRNAVLRLARQCDAVIVVGGKNSANTAMLAHIAASTGKPVWHIENESEVTDQMRGYATVGLASGTSTSLETSDGQQDFRKDLGSNITENFSIIRMIV
jgi:4-hydroxy-3-methylbut-2-enyl diphosphate reductase